MYTTLYCNLNNLLTSFFHRTSISCNIYMSTIIITIMKYSYIYIYMTFYIKTVKFIFPSRIINILKKASVSKIRRVYRIIYTYIYIIYIITGQWKGLHRNLIRDYIILLYYYMNKLHDEMHINNHHVVVFKIKRNKSKSKSINSH